MAEDNDGNIIVKLLFPNTLPDDNVSEALIRLKRQAGNKIDQTMINSRAGTLTEFRKSTTHRRKAFVGEW